MTRRPYWQTAFILMVLLSALCLSWVLSGPGPMSTKAEDDSSSAAHSPSWEPPARASFSIRYKDVESPFTITPALLMPGEELNVEAVSPDSNDTFEVQASHGRLVQTGVTRWSWMAPTVPGIYPVTVKNSLQSSITLNALVMVPRRPRRRALNGYPIGFYPSKPLKGNPVYLPPHGLVEVTEANQDVFLTPHFQLGQFVCKQGTTYPKYLVINERLLLKLELLLEEMNRLGHPVKTFHVMSGYRTPAYNRYLKNVRYSMHQFGYAADIFVDENPQDGIMDDLNGDGRIDQKDAEVITSIVAAMDQSEQFQRYIGGMGGYETNKAHGPFVHVDVRGWDARWGIQPSFEQVAMTER